MKKRNILQRLLMPLPDLEQYYRERRKARFEEGKKLTHVPLREKMYPLFMMVLKLDRLLRNKRIKVIGNHKVYHEQAIYACTHIGGDDLQCIYETLGRGCWWFVGDPGGLYKDISGLLLYLNGCIMLETCDKTDRHIAYLRAVELLQSGGSLMIFPEGARNGTANLPVMGLFQGTDKMAMETNTKIVPIAIEQYDNRFVVNFGEVILPSDYRVNTELTQAMRDALASLKWQIWEQEGQQKRSTFLPDYADKFVKEFESRIRPYDTLESVEITRFHTKDEIAQKEAFEHLERLQPCKENAFLFRTR